MVLSATNMAGCCGDLPVSKLKSCQLMSNIRKYGIYIKFMHTRQSIIIICSSRNKSRLASHQKYFFFLTRCSPDVNLGCCDLVSEMNQPVTFRWLLQFRAVIRYLMQFIDILKDYLGECTYWVQRGIQVRDISRRFYFAT